MGRSSFPQRCERHLDLGTERESRGLQVVYEALAIFEWGAASLDRIPDSAPDRLELGLAAGTAQPVRLGVDGRSRKALLLGNEDNAMRPRRRDGLDHLTGTCDEAGTGLKLGGHVRSDPGGDGPKPLDLAASQAQDGRRIGAAAAKARGDRDSLVHLDPEWGPVPAVLAQGSESRLGQVGLLDSLTDHLVLTRLGDPELVRQFQRLEQRADLVQAVVPSRADIEAQVELGRGEHPVRDPAHL